LSDEAKYPAQIDDVREAVKWLVEHSASYHFDTNKIFAIGVSAGGHLSLLLGLSQKPADRTIKAVCAFYPPSDLVAILPENMRDQTNNPVAELLGGPVSQKLALAREASPMTYVRKDSVPVLIYHGDADTLVPLAQSKSLDAALKAAGAQSTLILYKGQGHGFAPGDNALFQIANFFKNAVKN
jgi:acetyl esterase/lipase